MGRTRIMDMNLHHFGRRPRAVQLNQAAVTLLTVGLLLLSVAIGDALGGRAVVRAETPPASAPAKAEKADVDNSTWALTFADFFGPGTLLNVYPSRRDGKWAGA